MLFVRQARFWLALSAEFILLATLNRFDDWRYASMPVRFVETAVLCGIAYFAATSFFANLFTGRTLRVIFWSVAILLRLVALPLVPGDDLWRYQWEGKVQNAGFNPYLLAPNDDRLAEVRKEYPEWNQINHRNFSAIYPPGTELIFAGLSGVGAGTLAYKLLFAAADLGVIVLLLRLLGGRERYLDAAWYAWNPLVIYSFAGAAHFDSLMILPMLAGIFCFVRSRAAQESSGQWRWALLGAAAMGAAISIKLIPLLLLPVCAFALGRRAWALGLSLVIPALLSLPYGVPQVPIWQSLGKFVYIARVNDMFWWLIEETFWPNPHQKEFQLQRRHRCRRRAGFVFLRPQLAARFALGDGAGPHPQPGAASLVCHLDPAAGRVAPGRCLAGALGHGFCLLPLLERAAFPSPLAFRALAPRLHPHPADRGHALCAAEKESA